MKPYYEASGITIYCGDCREILPQLGRTSAVITDPPYEAEAHTQMRRTRAQIEGRVAVAAMPFAAITEDLREFAVAWRKRNNSDRCQKPRT